MSSAVSPLAPTDIPQMPVVAGVKLATAPPASATGPYRRAARGARQGERGRRRLHQVEMPVGAGGMVPRKLADGQARALVVNSGNANAFTGKTGRQATALTASIAAKAARLQPQEVFLASTGVIGEPLDATKFDGVLGTLAQQAAPGEWMNAAKAIMTTDTFPKVATATVKLGKARSRSTAWPRAPA